MNLQQFNRVLELSGQKQLHESSSLRPNEDQIEARAEKISYEKTEEQLIEIKRIIRNACEPIEEWSDSTMEIATRHFPYWRPGDFKYLFKLIFNEDPFEGEIGVQMGSGEDDELAPEEMDVRPEDIF